MNIKNELHIAIERNQRVTLLLSNSEKISGLAEVSTDPERVKVRTSEGPVWVPYVDVEKVMRAINLFH